MNREIEYIIPKIEDFRPHFKYEVSTKPVISTLEKGVLYKESWYIQTFKIDCDNLDTIKALLEAGVIRTMKPIIISNDLYEYGELYDRAELKIKINSIPKICKKINEYYDFEIEILESIDSNFLKKWELFRVINGKIDRNSICGEWKPSTMYSHINNYELLFIKK